MESDYKRRCLLMYQLWMEKPGELRGDSKDWYQRGLLGIMRPKRGTLADAAWRAGHDTTLAADAAKEE